MVKKDIKYIISRIIIGVGILLIIGFINTLSITNVKALEVKSFATTNNANWASCSNCSVIDSNWNWNSGLHNVSGELFLNVLTYSVSNQGENIPVLTIVRIKIDGKNYNCHVNGYGNNYTLSNNTSAQKQMTSYSLICPVSFGDNGNFEHLYIQTNGTGNDGISFYSPFTFVYDNGQQEIIETVQENTNAIEDTNSILSDDNVSSDTSSSLSGILSEQSSNTPVADLILLPLTLYNAYLSGFNSSCSAFNLGSMFNHNLTLPCVDIDDIIGSGLWVTIDLLFSLFMLFNIFQLFIYMFESITSLEDPYRDNYVPKHGKKESDR